MKTPDLLDNKKFIKWLERFKNYFIKEVKLINGINKTKYEFILNIPSTFIHIEFVGNSFLKAEIEQNGYVEYSNYITKEEVKHIKQIIDEIWNHFKKNRALFEETRKSILEEIFNETL